MGKKDARVDDYIAKAPAFAKPILTEIRERVHAACPEVEETIKWRQPSFEYKGLMCGMAAFKEHCVIEWITEAKTETTRAKRIQQAVE
jgi:hypothetical protein